jgi:TetR/AcrR family transcriptional repressor of nem operon
MARSRKVEDADAIEAAMYLFWDRGYDATGTREIEEKTGLTRFSLQTRFGGKKALFLSALDLYLERTSKAEIEGDLEGIAQWFEARTASDFPWKTGIYGCLMQNTLTEFGDGDDGDHDLAQRSPAYYASISDMFRPALARAQAKGQLGKGEDIPAKAQTLSMALLGLNVVIRGARSNTAGASIAAAIARTVRDWNRL